VAIAPLPSGPPVVEGIIDVRGRVVPVLDIRRRFRLSPKPLDPNDHFILATAGTKLVGLRVDAVTELSQARQSDIEDARGVIPYSEYVAGVAKLEGGLVLIHDLKTFLSQGEAAALSTALAGAPA
jgi:purine-binding chemotaxis protein CheW